MKKWIAGAILFGLLVSTAGTAAADTINPAGSDPLEVELKQLYSEPTKNSNLIFEIPIEVKLLDVSENYDWYKVKISFGIGPFVYTYVGWTKIPLTQILAEREEEISKIALKPAGE